MNKRISISILVLLALVVLVGCGTKTDGNESVKNKDELVVRLGSEPSSGFDPTEGWGRYGSPLFQSTLLKRDKDMKIVNDLATGYTVSEDGLTWNVKLREDVKFSDGQPLTSKDIVYTFETAAKAASIVDLTVLDSVNADGDYAVNFKLKEARSTFVTSLVAQGIVPEHAHNASYGDNPIGSGPFKLVQWDKEQQVIIEPNKEYYGNKSDFKKITILFLDEDASIAAAKAGTLDITAVPATMATQEIEGMKKVVLDSVDNRGIAWPVQPSGKETADGAPIGNDVTSHVAIRKAVDLAVNRAGLIEGILNGYGKKASSIADGMPWYNEETEVSENAKLDEANKVLEEAGWIKNADGIREKNGLKAAFELMYPSSDDVRQSLAMAVADEMKAIGLEVTPEGRSWDELGDLMHANPVLMGWGGYDPFEMYNVYHSKTAGVEWYNTGFYSNEKVDSYLDKALQETSEDKALEFWKKAQWDGETGFSSLGDVAWTWLVNIDHIYFVRDGLEIGEYKVQPHGHGWPVTDNISEWVWK